MKPIWLSIRRWAGGQLGDVPPERKNSFGLAEMVPVCGWGGLFSSFRKGWRAAALAGTVEWLCGWPHRALLNLLFIFCFMAVFVALSGRFFLGLLVSFFLLFVLSLINQTKILHLHLPFFAWDLLNFKEAFAILKLLTQQHVSPALLALLGAAAGGLLWMLFNLDVRIRWLHRILLLSVFSAFPAVLVYHRAIPQDLLGFLAAENTVWHQASNDERNGFLRIPAQTVHSFRTKLSTHSGGSCPLIPG